MTGKGELHSGFCFCLKMMKLNRCGASSFYFRYDYYYYYYYHYYYYYYYYYDNYYYYGLLLINIFAINIYVTRKIENSPNTNKNFRPIFYLFLLYSDIFSFCHYGNCVK